MSHSSRDFPTAERKILEFHAVLLFHEHHMFLYSSTKHKTQRFPNNPGENIWQNSTICARQNYDTRGKRQQNRIKKRGYAILHEQRLPLPAPPLSNTPGRNFSGTGFVTSLDNPLAAERSIVSNFPSTRIERSTENPRKDEHIIHLIGKVTSPSGNNACSSFFASSGIISGVGLLIASTTGSFAIFRISSASRRFGAETPINTSALLITSFKLPPSS